MTRWLFVNELGGGLGHMVRLRHLARALVRPGERLAVAAHDVGQAKTLFRGIADRVLPAPPLDQIRDQPLPGPAGILEAFGFGDPARLTRVTRAWRRLIADHRIDAIVADFAPFATFAARGMAPVFQIGSGFDLPGRGGKAFLPFDPADAPAPDAPLLANAQRVARRLHMPVPANLPDAVSGDQSFLVTLPWIDPFAGRRSEVALGPLGRRPRLIPAPSEGHILVYADAGAPIFGALMRTLVDLPLRRTVYWQGGTPAVRHLMADQGIEIPDSPPDPATLLPTTTLVVSHGGAGLMAETLLAGRPHICLPTHREAALNAAALAATGAGRVPQDQHPETLYWTIVGALNDIPLRDRALEMGEAAQAGYGVNPAGHVAGAIRSVV